MHYNKLDLSIIKSLTIDSGSVDKTILDIKLLDKMGEVEKQMHRLESYHLLMDLRGVYKKTGIVDNPVPLLCFWSDLWILYHILCISILGGYGTDVYSAFSFHFFLIQIYYFVIS